MNTFKVAVAALSLAVSFAGSAAAGPYEDGIAAFKRRDYVTAMQLFRPLAEQGEARSQVSLGAMYELTQDYAAAVSWFRKAADQDDAQAQTMLGNVYFSGKGVPQDYGQAAAWFRKAADQGYAAGQSLLGVMYAGGHGVPQDYVSADMWFNLAATAGNKGAAKLRDKVEATMTPAQVAEAQRLTREWKARQK